MASTPGTRAGGDRWRASSAGRNAHRLAVGALGVDSRASAEVLQDAGIDLLAGGAVAAMVDRPGAAYKLRLAA